MVKTYAIHGFGSVMLCLQYNIEVIERTCCKFQVL